MGKNKKNKKPLIHVTYNQKAFLAPGSILSMAAIHTKIKDDGIAILRISDCNQSVRIWNDFNTNEGKLEMIEKVDMLLEKLSQFKTEIICRCPKNIFAAVKIYDVEFEEAKHE